MKRSFFCPVERERRCAFRAPGPRDHILGCIRQAEPITASRLAEVFKVFEYPLSVVETAIDELIARGVVKRWADNTPSGRCRVFVGTVNQHGLAEPTGDIDGEPATVDPRTVLAIVRAAGFCLASKMARHWTMPIEPLCAAADQLERQGHLKVTRRLGVAVRLSAVDPGWNWN